MALHALKIVREEIAKAYLSFEDDGRGHVSVSSVNARLGGLQAKIVQRIAEECIEQPDPDECQHTHDDHPADPRGCAVCWPERGSSDDDETRRLVEAMASGTIYQELIPDRLFKGLRTRSDHDIPS